MIYNQNINYGLPLNPSNSYNSDSNFIHNQQYYNYPSRYVYNNNTKRYNTNSNDNVLPPINSFKPYTSQDQNYMSAYNDFKHTNFKLQTRLDKIMKRKQRLLNKQNEAFQGRNYYTMGYLNPYSPYALGPAFYNESYKQALINAQAQLNGAYVNQNRMMEPIYYP